MTVPMTVPVTTFAQFPGWQLVLGRLSTPDHFRFASLLANVWRYVWGVTSSRLARRQAVSKTVLTDLSGVPRLVTNTCSLFDPFEPLDARDWNLDHKQLVALRAFVAVRKHV
jgi:hypothetical protein